jgi:hypothetical protein
MKYGLKKGFANLFSSASRLPTKEASFQYEALEPDQFRILTLLPGSISSPLSCKLEVTHQNVAPLQFTALSWTWGPQVSNSKTIRLNDIPHSIRPSLYEALEALRSPDESRRLWVDAVCINQHDDEEKSSQIPLMASIYRLADHVLVWLGKEANDSKYLMECIRHDRKDEFGTTRFQEAMLRFAERPWFRRVWIIQEFALSKLSPQIACGSGPFVDWDCLHIAWDAAMESIRRILVHPEAFMLNGGNLDADFLRKTFTLSRVRRSELESTILDIKTVRDQFQGLGHLNLAEVLMNSVGSQSSDARDHVYGVLGLLSADKRARFLSANPIDYTKSTIQIYQEATIFLLTAECIQNSSIFTHFGFPSAHGPSVPSWVLGIGSPSENSKPLLAYSQDNQVAARISADKRTMLTHGLLLDEVSEKVTVPSSMKDVVMSRSLTWLLYPIYGLTCIVAIYRGWAVPRPVQAKEDAEMLSYIRHFLINLYLIDCLVKKVVIATELSEPVWKTLLTGSIEELSNETDYQATFEEMVLVGSLRPSLIPYIASPFQYTSFFKCLNASLKARSFFRGTEGWYGIARGTLKEGDRLALLFSPQLYPFIIRPVADKFELVGAAYVPPALREAALARTDNELIELSVV